MLDMIFINMGSAETYLMSMMPSMLAEVQRNNSGEQTDGRRHRFARNIRTHHIDNHVL